jgi:hypothetical protein
MNGNFYILLMGDLNARTEYKRLGKIIGKENGEPTINSSGKRLTLFCCFKEFRILNNFLQA